MKNYFVYSIIILSLLVTVISCKRTAIEGKVLDGFGNPVKGATVKVAGTQFTSQTDASGQYSVGYVPGDIKVLISKEGFTDTSFSVSIATESTFPAETTSIFEIPKEIGIFVMQNGVYVPLTKGEVSHKSENIEKFMFTSKDKTVFYLSFDEENVLTIKKQAGPTYFFDNDPNNTTLFKVSKYPGYNTIMERQINNGNLGFSMGDFKDRGILVSEKYQIFKNNLALRIAEIEEGDYVFIQYWQKSGNPLQGIPYVFRVTN